MLTLVLACDGRQPIGQSEATTSSVSENQGALGHLVQGVNLSQTGFTALADEYSRQIPKNGPDPGLKLALHPSHVEVSPMLKAARAEIETALQAAAFADLGALALTCLLSLDALTEAFTLMEVQLRTRAFEQDNYQAATALHGRIAQTQADYRRCLAQLIPKLDEVEETYAEAELFRHADKPRVPYWRRRVQLAAKRLVRATSSREFEQRLAELSRSHQALESALSVAPEPAIVAFASKSARFEQLATELAEARFASFEPTRVQLLQRRFTIAYNELARSSNELRVLGK